jgi:D-alanine transaminase
MITYFNGAFTPLDDVSVSPFDRGFLFADGVYESIRMYHNKLFKYDKHLTRLKRSLNEIQIRYNDLEKLERVIYKLIKKNYIDEEALIYLQITRGKQFPRKHSFSQAESGSTIFISVTKFAPNLKEREDGIKVILQEDLRWPRCDIKSTSLLPVILANQKAKVAGAEEAILVRDELITEGTHTNFFAVKDHVIYTAPVSHYILAGITRGVVIELANDLNIHVKEESIKEKDLKTFNEFFITSTTKEVTPVVQLDDWIINDGKTGNVTTELQSAFSKLTENC